MFVICFEMFHGSLEQFPSISHVIRCRVREMKPIPSLDLGNVAGPAERDLCRRGTNPRGPASYKVWKSQVDLTIQFQNDSDSSPSTTYKA